MVVKELAKNQGISDVTKSLSPN